MARLYSAFDALGLGDAINRNQQRRLQNSMAINKLFADGIGNIAQGVKDWNDNVNKADAAEMLAPSYGIDNVQNLRGSLGDADFAKYVSGRMDEIDREGRQKKEWDRQHGITRGEHMEDAGFGLVKDLLIANMAAATGAIPTELDLKKRKQILDIANGFVNNNGDSKYTPLLQQLIGEFAGGSEGSEGPKQKTLSDYYDDISELLKQGEDGRFSISLDDLKNYRNERVNDKTWDQLAADKAFMNILRQNAAWLTDDPETIKAAFPELDGVYTYDEASRDIASKARAAQLKQEQEAHQKLMNDIQEKTARQNLDNSRKSGARADEEYERKQELLRKEERKKELESLIKKRQVPTDVTDEELETLWENPNVRAFLRENFKDRLLQLNLK